MNSELPTADQDFQDQTLQHAIARFFYAVGQQNQPLTENKLRDIEATVVRCKAFKEIGVDDLADILADARAVIEQSGEDALSDVNDIIGSENGPEMVDLLIGLVLSWNPQAEKTEQLMWHIPPDMGLSMDAYNKMWDRKAGKSTPRLLAGGGPAKAASSVSNRLKTEVKLLVQYNDEIVALKEQLTELEPRAAKQVQRQIEQKMQVFWKQITLVKAEFPDAAEGTVAEAGYYCFQAAFSILSSGLLRRFSQGGAPLALRMASGLAAKVQESNDVAKALELLDKSLRVFDTPDARLLKASIYAEKGRKEEALAELNHVIQHFSYSEEDFIQARKMKDQIENPPKKGCCFIATAAYGTPMATEVLLLSMFRDQVLLQSRSGRAFVTCYYRLSPPIAFFIGRFEILRAATRTFFLNPVIRTVRMICPQLSELQAYVNHHERH